MNKPLLPCPFCGGEAKITARDVEPQGDPWYGKNIQTFVICTNCGACLFDDYFHEGFADEHKATAAWNRRVQPENKPLTLDELKQMDGEPVWIVTLDGTDEPRWEIVVSARKCGVDLICVLNGVETRDYADFDLYNYTWLAYRNKPVKEEHHEVD